MTTRRLLAWQLKPGMTVKSGTRWYTITSIDRIDTRSIQARVLTLPSRQRTQLMLSDNAVPHEVRWPLPLQPTPEGN